MGEVKINLNIDQMKEAGVHFGHRVSKLHPKMKDYVSGIKNNVHIIDLEKTAKDFEVALRYMASVVAEGKTVLLVGTKIQMRDIVKQTAVACNMPYVSERWLGGIFTNFGTISKRVQYYKDLQHQKATGQFEKYTKKERLQLDKEMHSLKNKFEGIEKMASLPEAVLILDLKKDLACQREAKRKGIKIIGLVDTSIDPVLADYPIPANDDSISSVKYILEKVQEAILMAK